MITRELLEFLRTQLKKGISRPQLSQILLAQGGWAQADLAEAYAQIDAEAGLPPPPASLSTETPSVRIFPVEGTSGSAQSKQIFDVSQLHLGAGEDFLGIFQEKSKTLEKQVTKANQTGQLTPVNAITKESGVVLSSQVTSRPSVSGVFSEKPLVSPLGTATPKTPSGGVIPARTTGNSSSVQAQRAIPPLPVRMPPIAGEVRAAPPSPTAKIFSPARNVSVLGEKSPAAPSTFIPTQTKILQPSSASTPQKNSESVVSQKNVSQPAEKKNYDTPPPVPIPGLAKEIAQVLGAGESVVKKSPSRISRIAPPKRTLQDLFAELQGQNLSSAAQSEPQQISQDQETKEKQEHFKSEEKPSIFVAQTTNEQGVAKSENVKTDQSASAPLSFGNVHPVKNALLGVVVLLVITLTIAGYYIFASRLRTPTPPDIGAFFQSLSSLSYTLSVDSDLSVREKNEDENASSSLFRFALRSQGWAAQKEEGFGDGEHRVVFSGGFQHDPIVWSTDVEGIVRIIGNTLYFNAKKTPVNGSVDQQLLESHWIEVELDEISRELALTGTSGDEYSGFFAGQSGATFTAILARNNPFVIHDDGIKKKFPDGTEVYEYQIRLDPRATTLFIAEIVKAYKGKDVVLSDEDRIFLEEAWEKVSGSILLNANDGSLRMVTLSFSPNNVMYGKLVTGTLSISLDVNGVNTPMELTIPENLLTLLELRAEMQRYQEKMRIAGLDMERATQLGYVGESLKAYKEKNKRYPTTLKDILSNEMYAPKSASSTILSQIVYYGYTEEGKFDKSHRCVSSSSRCDEYHMGIDLADLENPSLDIDRDIIGEIIGDDNQGCTKKTGFACLDQTASLPVIPQTASTSPSTQE